MKYGDARMKSALDTALRRLAAAGLLALLPGCGPQAGHEAAEQPPAPSADELRRAAHPGYVPTPGSRQECLGRLVFEAPKDMEWGIAPHDLRGHSSFRFAEAENMHGPQDMVSVASVRIFVASNATWNTIERMQTDPASGKHISIHRYRNDIETGHRRKARLEAVLKDPSLNINNYDTSTYPESIKKIEKTIRDDEASIAMIERHWQPMDLGLPDALGYAAGSTFYAFLLRDGRAYQFMDSRGSDETPFEERKAAFFRLLRNFRTRALYEVPTEPGVCIPYGFIADDGTGYVHAEVSLRHRDRPGVIYSLGSRVIDGQGYFGEAPMLTAAARSAGVVSAAAGVGATARAVGPRPASIGALEGWQGGAVVNLAAPGEPPVWNYSVYTGYAGYPQSRILPSIRVELRSFLKTPEKPPRPKPAPPNFRENTLALRCSLDRRKMSFDLRLIDQGLNGEPPWAYTKWALSHGEMPQGVGAVPEEEQIASGVTGEDGKLALSASQQKALAKAYAANIDRVWISYPGGGIGLLGQACGDWKRLETAYAQSLARAQKLPPAPEVEVPIGDAEVAKRLLGPTYQAYSASDIVEAVAAKRLMGLTYLPLPEVPEAEAAILKENPPPIEESLQRLDVLLKSIRLRPTEPPMPGMPTEG
jgi:hypothetical protein